MEITAARQELDLSTGTEILPGSFEPEDHFYPRVLNAQIHPSVSFFLRLQRSRVVNRYCHLNPRVDPNFLMGLLSHEPRYFQWAGADLFHATTADGDRQMVVVETNSCPSGNKSMPIPSDEAEQGGYRTLLEHTFLPLLRKARLPGRLAVIYDKNHIEAKGYARALADLTQEPVLLTPFPDAASDPPTRFEKGILYIRDSNHDWVPARAAFRYVTQRPWNRIPIRTRTKVLNPIIGCLAGGRNKLVGAKAYDLYNAELEGTGLRIHTPETIRDVRREEIPLWVRKFGGYAVVKVPYRNAGQGVTTIVRPSELEALMESESEYDQFIVQSLIGNSSWSSESEWGRLYHVGTMPNRKGEIHVADLRMMVAAGPNGFLPLAIYARRAASPLPELLDPQTPSWNVLGTNLSTRSADGDWAAQTDRLLLVDRRDFNSLGLGLDDLIEAFIQTVLSAIAIDRMATTLITTKGELRVGLFRSLDNDEQLLREVARGRSADSTSDRGGGS